MERMQMIPIGFLCLACVLYAHADQITAGDLKKAFDSARKRMDKTRQTEENFLKTHTLSPFVFSPEKRLLIPATEPSQRMHRTALELEYVTEYFIKRNRTPSELQQVQVPMDEPVVMQCESMRSITCDKAYPYRSINGSCNNVDYPTWGMASSCYGTVMAPDYADGLSSPRRGKRKQKLPSARLLSTTVHPDVDHPAQKATLAVMAWGQFVGHDTGLLIAPYVGKNDNMSMTCCPSNCQKDKTPDLCFPIDIPTNDSFFGPQGRTCMDFQRAGVASYDCKLGSPRRHVNQQTAYLDASAIYGATEGSANFLRSFQGGRLQSQGSDHGELLPESPMPAVDQCSGGMGKFKCFASGDLRANGQPGLAAMHTIMHRWHNTIADVLHQANPKMQDEELYQEARRIVGAGMQKITYCEFLPTLLDPEWIRKNYLNVCDGFRTKYNSTVNASTSIEFATGAFRLGHSLPQNYFHLANLPDLSLVEGMFHPMFLYQGHLDNLLTGLSQQPAEDFDRFFANSLTNHLFQVRNGKYGGDLVALGIQRGRDMGLPSYTQLVKYCTGHEITSFKNLSDLELMSKETVKLLQSVYDYPEDIDAYPGGFSELRKTNYLLTPTFSCLIAEQFRRFIFGDRFFFSHEGESGSFTKGQYEVLKDVSLASVFCQTSAVGNTTARVFEKMDETNPSMRCSDIPSPDFRKWRINGV